MLSLALRGHVTPIAIFFFTAILPCSAQLEPGFHAHGGLDKWQQFAAVEYDSSWESAKGSLLDHQLFDLRTRSGVIIGKDYALGADHGEVWIRPGADALHGTPPRFYMWTPFYFFGMPFVFGDPGAAQEELGKKSFQGREFDAIKITFKKGTGDTPDDFYVAYLDPQTRQLKLAAYVVTFPTMRKGRPVEQLAQHAIVFEGWQQADGLLVPKQAQFYNWVNGNTEGEQLGKLEFSNVHFSKAEPDSSKFRKPDGAVIASMP